MNRSPDSGALFRACPLALSLGHTSTLQLL